MVGLFFGSFNPIHLGHTALAEYLLAHTELSEIWFVVSPQNPMKENAELLPDEFRLHLVQLAIAGHKKFQVCDIEFSLSKPNYTVNTLDALTKKYPDNEFSLIIGADNLAVFDKWKSSEKILSSYGIFVYPREGFDLTELKKKYPQVTIVDAPLYLISSTVIRSLLQQKKDASQWLHPLVLNEVVSFF